MTIKKSANDQCSLVYPAIPGRRQLTAELMWSIPRVGAPSPAPDGRSLVVPVTTYSREDNTGTTRLWLVSINADGPRPLTAADANAANAVWSPDGTRLAFTRTAKDVDDAKPQLYVMRLDGGEPERITEMPLGVIDAQWLPDALGLVFAAKLMKGHLTVEGTQAEIERRADEKLNVHATEDRVYRYWDTWLTGGEVPHLFHVDLANGHCRDLIPNSTAWFDFMQPSGQFDISPDGREVTYAAVILDEEINEITTQVFRVAIDAGEPECLTSGAPANCWGPKYTADGTSIVYGRNEDRYFYADRARIYRFDRTSGKHSAWCTDWDNAPTQWSLSPDGSLIFAAEAGGRSNIYTLAADAMEPRLFAGGGTGSSPRSCTDGFVYFQSQTLQSPPEVFRVSAVGGPVQRVTSFTEEVLADVARGEVRELFVTGAEGEPVQSFVVLPPDHDDSQSKPFLNMVHGGPHGIFGDGFHWRWNSQVFACAGYVVATPNFQGSTSWGTDYASRIQGAWGDRPYRDVMAVTDALIESGLIDSERMAAAGGSYGGYMMGWIAGHTDRFRCIVNHAGVWNTLAQACASDVTQGRSRAYGGHPWDGLDRIDEYNPARFTSKIVTPMLVIHGEKDFRVPVTQSLECYGMLKSKGVAARLLHFPDENHWILKKHNSIRWYSEIIDWLTRWCD